MSVPTLHVGDALLFKTDGANAFAVCLPDIQGHKLYFDTPQDPHHEAPHNVASSIFVVRRPGYYDNRARMRKLQQAAEEPVTLNAGESSPACSAADGEFK